MTYRTQPKWKPKMSRAKEEGAVAKVKQSSCESFTNPIPPSAIGALDKVVVQPVNGVSGETRGDAGSVGAEPGERAQGMPRDRRAGQQQRERANKRAGGDSGALADDEPVCLGPGDLADLRLAMRVHGTLLVDGRLTGLAGWFIGHLLRRYRQPVGTGIELESGAFVRRRAHAG